MGYELGPIDGIELLPLKVLRDDRGAVMHMMRTDSPAFKSFGEVYFSQVKKGVVKAWKKHLEMTQNLAVPVGEVRIVLYDDRPRSLTRGRVQEIKFGENNYSLLKIPPHIWYGFQGMNDGFALIANCTDIPFRENEVVRADLAQGPITFQW